MIRWPVSLLLWLLAMSAGAQLFRGGGGDGYATLAVSGLISGLPAPSIYFGGDADGADVDEVQSLADGSGPADLDTLYDQDMDLMPDFWEVDNDLDYTTPADAAKDPDGDHAASLDEWIADTDPQDIASVFAIEITLGPTPTESTLGFPSSTARVYRVEYRLTSPTNDWFNLGTSFPGDGGWMLHDVGHPDTRTLYRMKVGLP